MSIAHYILLDAARMDENLDKATELNHENLCLFSGKGEEYLKTVSPYLFDNSVNEELEKWFIDFGWGHSWGVFVVSKIMFAEVFKHFRKLLVVKTESNEEMFFRFYDPRVLAAFLPTCYKEQLIEFFGPIEKFICEDKDRSFALIFSLSNGELKVDRVPANDILKSDISIENNEKSEINQSTDDQPSENKIPPNRKWNFLIE